MKLVHKTVASILGYADEDEFDADKHKHFKLSKRGVERKILGIIDPKSAIGLPQKLGERILMNIIAQQSFEANREQNGFMETAESAAFGTAITFSAPYYLPRVEKTDGLLHYYLSDTPTPSGHTGEGAVPPKIQYKFISPLRMKVKQGAYRREGAEIERERFADGDAKKQTKRLNDMLEEIRSRPIPQSTYTAFPLLEGVHKAETTVNTALLYEQMKRANFLFTTAGDKQCAPVAEPEATIGYIKEYLCQGDGHGNSIPICIRAIMKDYDLLNNAAKTVATKAQDFFRSPEVCGLVEFGPKTIGHLGRVNRYIYACIEEVLKEEYHLIGFTHALCVYSEIYSHKADVGVDFDLNHEREVGMTTMAVLGALHLYMGDEASDSVASVRKTENRQRQVKPLKRHIMDRVNTTGDYISMGTFTDIYLGPFSTAIMPLRLGHVTMLERAYTKATMVTKYHTRSLAAYVLSQSADANNCISMILHPLLRAKPRVDTAVGVEVEEVIREINAVKIVGYIVNKRVSPKKLAERYAELLGHPQCTPDEFMHKLVQECFHCSAEEQDESATKRLGKHILPHLYEGYRCDSNDNDDDDEDGEDNPLDDNWLDEMVQDEYNITDDEDI
jgi:hypothetical protein